MDLMLDGRTVLVTGGSSGVGLATVAGLVDEGANVVTCARRLDVLEKTLADRGIPGDRVLARACDVRDEHAVRALVAAAEDRMRARGASTMQLQILTPRGRAHPGKARLRDWYERLGYRFARTEPFAAPRLTTPCEFEIFRKRL